EYEFKLPYNLEPKKIYELVLGMETATLNIITTPDNATIYIDDEKVGVGYGSKAVSIGAEHRYKVECENYITEENVVVFTEKEKKEIAVELRPNFGFITVKTTPSGADVYVDDKLVGKTPYLSEVIKRGMHKITVNKEGYETTVQRVNIDLNEEKTVEFELVEGESSMPVQKVVQQPVAQPVAAQKPANGVVTDADGNMVATVNDVTFKMIKVEGGTFTMGEDKEAHEVTLSDYYIGEFEVTQELWEAVMGSNPSRFKGSKLPVEKVSWDDCQEFISKLNGLTGKTFRLPTEAQWEYAARGGNKSKGYEYSGSNVIDEVAWYDDNSGRNTRAVGTKLPNELGIYDMSGNVYEWCQDRFGSYGSGSQTNPQGPSWGSFRVLRGGSRSCRASVCRVSFRYRIDPGGRINYSGLRLALVL
ncbi:MAG: SUMF1/EgtB/PvdO family nonheme iron enzyme, partial [Bacteroidia bacterium]|nr:SUMF1/EgtB/PvdO family nonheme iron enzyme [Bacteroidia bacterium]